MTRRIPINPVLLEAFHRKCKETGQDPRDVIEALARQAVEETKGVGRN